MKSKDILVFCCILGAVLGLFIAYETFVAAPASLVKTLSAAVGEIFQNKITENVQNDTLGVKPIAELALADVRVRSIVDYNEVSLMSKKAHDCP